MARKSFGPIGDTGEGSLFGFVISAAASARLLHTSRGLVGSAPRWGLCVSLSGKNLPEARKTTKTPPDVSMEFSRSQDEIQSLQSSVSRTKSVATSRKPPRLWGLQTPLKAWPKEFEVLRLDLGRNLVGDPTVEAFAELVPSFYLQGAEGSFHLADCKSLGFLSNCDISDIS